MKCPRIPSPLLETFTWEHPAIRTASAAAEVFGDSEARPELAAVGSGGEPAVSVGPSEMLLPLLPPWPVCAASTTTGEQRQRCKHCGYYGIVHTKRVDNEEQQQ